MTRHRTGLIALVYIVLHVSVLAFGCVYQECYCVGVTIICENLKLKQVPTTNVTNFGVYTALVLNYNMIMNIPAGSLPPNMTEIDLVENPTKTIDNTAFDSSSSTLQTLTFTLALFTRIPDAFGHLQALESLTLHDTHIHDWNEDAMKNIGKTLKMLDLENVGLVSWPTWIQYFSSLTNLIISNGFISNIPDDAMDQVANSLISLSLINNSLTAVPKAISKLVSLQQLFLQQNKIIDVTWLPHSNQLTILWLNDNRISNASQLSESLRQLAGSLTNIQISDNQLTSIPDVAFLIHVGELDFSHNRISDQFSGSLLSTMYTCILSYNFLSAIPHVLKTLQQINEIILPWNLIRELHATDFPSSVTFVELGYNLITEITNTSFPQNSQIATLHLNHNPIVRISNEAFRNVPNLIELNLQNSQLTRLPLGLSLLKNISMFDMTGSANLVCTCMENSLENWVVSHSPDNILGDCGHASIYNFFLELSPGCPTQ